MQRFISCALSVVVTSAVFSLTAAAVERGGFVRGPKGNAGAGRSFTTSRSAGMTMPYRGQIRPQLVAPQLAAGRATSSGPALVYRRAPGGVPVPNVTPRGGQAAGNQLGANSAIPLNRNSQIPGQVAKSRRVVTSSNNPLPATTRYSARRIGPQIAQQGLLPLADRDSGSAGGRLQIAIPSRSQQGIGTNSANARNAVERVTRPATEDTKTLARVRKSVVQLRQPIPGVGPGTVLPVPFHLDQKIDKELDEPTPDGVDHNNSDGLDGFNMLDFDRDQLRSLYRQRDTLWAASQFLLELYGNNQSYSFVDIWGEYLEILRQIAQLEIGHEIYPTRRIPINKLPGTSGDMGSTPESDFPAGGEGASEGQQGPIIPIERQVVTMPGKPLTPDGSGTLGDKVEGGNQDGGVEDPQKGGGGGGINDDDGTDGGNEYPTGGGDQDSHPQSNDNEGGGDDTEDGNTEAGGTGDGADDGGTTYYEPRSQRDPWGYVEDGVEVEVEHHEDGLPLSPEEGGGGGGNDIGASGKISKEALGVTTQEKDLVGPAFGTSTGPDDKDRPNTGGHSSQNTSDPNDDLGNDLPGDRLSGPGAEPWFNFRDIFYGWLGVDPEITHQTKE